MTREEIVRMAREAGIERCTCKSSTCNLLHSVATFDHLQRFYALAVAAEREACAQVSDRMASRCNDMRAAALEMASENIRARGQQQ